MQDPGHPAPKPCFLGAKAAAVVLEHIEGAPEFAPSSIGEMLQQMATQLALIHRITPTREFEFLSRRNDSAMRDVLRAPKRLDATLNEPKLRRLVAVLDWEERDRRPVG